MIVNTVKMIYNFVIEKSPQYKSVQPAQKMHSPFFNLGNCNHCKKNYRTKIIRCNLIAHHKKFCNSILGF